MSGRWIGAARSVAREVERNRRAHERQQLAAARQAERARKERERLTVQTARAEKQRQIEEEIARAAAATHQVGREVAKLQSILADGVQLTRPIDFESLKTRATIPAFEPGSLAVEEQMPVLDAFLPPSPSVVRRMIPGGSSRYEQKRQGALAAFDSAVAIRSMREEIRKAALANAQEEYVLRVAQIRERTAQQHAEIDAFNDGYRQGERGAIEQYCAEVLDRSHYPDDYPEDFPKIFRIAFVEESKQIVVEYDFPTIDAIPDAESYAYNKSKGEIVKKTRPDKQRRELYASLLAQITLRTLYEIFIADTARHIESVVFNGYVETIDPATGATVRSCLVSVRTTRGTLNAVDLTRVEPMACLRGLKASVSRSPSELAAVRPLLEFDMVDRRFIEGSNVLSTLDQRPNLMALTPSEFEALISNLFESMGLQTRLTQASRDGGVDCVAYDTRPIFGGKVVIQAKRYKNTVGVSAVRDLFGTVQNEGASKGILVTTSGYGSASMEFAAGKPLELLDGANLLYLLHEHADIDAKIEIPDGWQDPSAAG